MISLGAHVVSVRVPDTTYFMVSLKNGAPGSSSTVRVDQAGSNIWYVVRPSRIARQPPVTAARCSPICGSNPKSKVHTGASITPSRLMNSCTRILPISPSCRRELLGVAEGVRGRLDLGDVGRPVRLVPDVALVASAASVDRLAQDVAVPGVVGGLVDHAHDQLSERRLTMLLGPPGHGGRG